ncbi:MAG: alpha/beta fold hydrolase [Desulfobacteraceae bacterium]|nr:alpha/beta fold hydrolase [Desulfobacteraceae bacterium]
MNRRLFTIALVICLSFLYGCASIQDNIYDFFINVETSRSDLVRQTVTVDGQKMAYLERKGTGQTIVLLHGFSADKNNWLRFVRYLPENYRVLAIDMPGHGDNIQDLTKKYDPASLSSGVSKMLDTMGVDRFHIVGNSLGGLVSKIYAFHNPEKIITLGLFDSAGVTPSDPGEFFKGLEKGYNPFDVKTRQDYDVLKAYAFHNHPFIPWPVDAVVARKRIKRNDFNQKMFKDVSDNKMFRNSESQNEMLSGLKMSVIVIWGDKDRILSITSVQVYTQYLQNLEAYVIKDCGHIPMLERPEETATYYVKFISKY